MSWMPHFVQPFKQEFVKIHVEDVESGTKFLIEEELSKELGINEIQFFVEEKYIIVSYDPAITNSQSIRQTILRSGHEAVVYQAPVVPSVKKQQCLLSVKGMTCASCVKTIRKNLAKVAGIINVDVKLEEGTASIDYNVNRISAQDIAEKIDGMGFECAVLKASTSETVELTCVKPKKSTIRLVEISAVTEKDLALQLISLDGIEDVAVSMEKNFVEYTYFPNKISRDEIIQKLETFGLKVSIPTYTASQATISTVGTAKQSSSVVRKASQQARNIYKQNNIVKEPKKKSLVDKMQEFSALVDDEERKKCTLHISGMTCSSCVRGIEKQVLSKLKGVHMIMVSLIAQKAEVLYNPTEVSPDTIAKTITDLGFPATVIKGNETGETSSVEVLIDTVRDSSTAQAIENALKELPGVTNAVVSQEGSKALVLFNVDLVGARVIVEKIESMGYGAKVMSPAKQVALNHDKEIKQWRASFMFSLLFFIPALGVIIYFMAFPCSHNDPDCYSLAPWLDLQTLLLMSLSTPIMFVGGRHFYAHAWKAVKNGMVNMDVLVVLSATCSYVYSVVVVILAYARYASRCPMTFFDVPLALFTFISLGRWLENIAKGKTSESISKLVALQSPEAILVETDPITSIISERIIAIELVQKGDILKILPGSRIPVDGYVVNGASEVDESLITGEPTPVAKTPDCALIAGTVNTLGVLLMKATRIGDDSTLWQIVHLVEVAQLKKAPIQQLADRLAGYFVPAVISVSLITLTAWILFGEANFDDFLEFTHNENFEKDGYSEDELVMYTAFKYAISVLAIACPCALGLATPTAVMVSTGVGAQNGILLKGADAIEIASKATVVIFDKTGTITKGKLTLTRVSLIVNESECSLIQVLAIAGTAESGSEHIAGRAITEGVQNALKTKATGKCSDFLAVPGSGIKCKVSDIEAMIRSAEHNSRINDFSNSSYLSNLVRTASYVHYDIAGSELDPKNLFKTRISQLDAQLENSNSICSMKAFNVYIGNRDWIIRNGVMVPEEVSYNMSMYEASGSTVIFCVVDDILVAAFVLSDTVKPEAFLTVYTLKKMGRQVVLLTGDNTKTALAIARQVGIDIVFAEQLPSQKVSRIVDMQMENKKVIMVGDGINDSPALTQADVGIAIGSGTDIAIEAAAVVLIRNDLVDVIATIDLSRTTVKRIRLNFTLACIYNIIAIPIATGMFVYWKVSILPWMGAAAMVVSSWSVVLSSLLLRWWKKPKREKLETAAYKAAKEEREQRLEVGIGDTYLPSKHSFAKDPTKRRKDDESTVTLNAKSIASSKSGVLNRALSGGIRGIKKTAASSRNVMKILPGNLALNEPQTLLEECLITEAPAILSSGSFQGVKSDKQSERSMSGKTESGKIKVQERKDTPTSSIKGLKGDPRNDVISIIMRPLNEPIETLGNKVESTNRIEEIKESIHSFSQSIKKVKSLNKESGKEEFSEQESPAPKKFDKESASSSSSTSVHKFSIQSPSKVKTPPYEIMPSAAESVLHRWEVALVPAQAKSKESLQLK